MIQTSILNTDPAILYHQVTGCMSESEAIAGARDALALLDRLQGKRPIGVVLDLRNYTFDDLQAHRAWSVHFKQKLAGRNVDRVALIGKDNPTLEAEKTLMESDNLRFFSEPDAAKKWFLT